jgi:hypothetical protein
MAHSVQMYGTPFYFMIPGEGVVVQTRYIPEIERSVPTPTLPPGQEESLLPTPELPLATAAAAPQPVATVEPAAPSPWEHYGVVAFLMVRHYFHNLITSAMVFPLRGVFDDLSHHQSRPQTRRWQSVWVRRPETPHLGCLARYSSCSPAPSAVWPGLGQACWPGDARWCTLPVIVEP